MTSVDPVDGSTFYHANEYYTTLSSFNWHTRIGKFTLRHLRWWWCSLVLQARCEDAGRPTILLKLQWSPADGGNINVLRNSVVVHTTADDGKAKDKLGSHTGTFTYQVCETDSGDCSNEVRQVREVPYRSSYPTPKRQLKKSQPKGIRRRRRMPFVLSSLTTKKRPLFRRLGTRGTTILFASL